MGQTMWSQLEESIRKISSSLARLTAGLILVIGTYTGAESPDSAENSEMTIGGPLQQAGPVENPGSAVPPRGYQSRPCGFDLNHNGVAGEPADCNVCDASLVSGKVVSGTDRS